MDADQLYAELSSLTGLSPAAWADICSCSEDEQATILDGYTHMSWVQAPDQLARVMAVLSVLSAVLGVISGVGGAVGVIKSLSAL